MSLRTAMRVCAAVIGALLLSGSAEAATITLQWDRNPETDVQGYWVSYGTSSRVYTAEVNVGNNISHVLTLNPNQTTTYYFAVQAYNAAGRSAFSVEVSTTVTTSTPVLQIDLPGANATVPPDMLLSGWAIDQASTTGTGVDTLHVYLQPTWGGSPYFLGIASYGSARPDVGTAYGARFANSGFSLPIQGLSPGTYDIVVYARSTVANTFNINRTRRITVSNAVPQNGTILQIDMPSAHETVPGWVYVRGWSIDRRSTGSGPGIDAVQIMAYPNPGSGQLPWFIGMATYGGARADVQQAYGNARFRNSGFSFDIAGLPPGSYDLVLLARNTINSGWESARVRRVNIDPALRVAIDMPTDGSSANNGTFWLAGWAIDRRATSNTGVDAILIYAYPASGGQPIYLASATPDLARPDVAAAYGANFRDCGYMVPISGLAAGTYDIAVIGHSSVTNAYDNVAFRRITVQ